MRLRLNKLPLNVLLGVFMALCRSSRLHILGVYKVAFRMLIHVIAWLQGVLPRVIFGAF